MLALRSGMPLLFLVCTSGCATSNTGFTDQAFVSKDSGYSIGYAGDTFSPLGKEWQLENYVQGEKGRPREEKNVGIYLDRMPWVQPDGSEIEVSYLPYDLKFRHGNGSLLVVATVAVPRHLRNLRLSAVAEEWANSYSGIQFSFKRGEGQRMASKIIESKGRDLAGRPAREVTFDVVDVDQLQLDPNAPRKRIRAVFVQAPLYKVFQWPSLRIPAFLLVAYISDERRFDTLASDLESVLGKIRINRN